jgi:hypothetical protein
MRYEYVATTNYVAPEQVSAHLQRLDEVYENLFYTLTWRNEDPARKAENFNWSVSLLAGFYAMILVIAALFAYRWNFNFGSHPLQLKMEHPTLIGLGGWLVVVGLSMVTNPLLFLASLFKSAPAYSLTNWHAYTTPGGEFYHPLYVPLLICELLGNITLLVCSILAAFLFFKKRRTFPPVFILLMLGVVLLVGLEYAAGFWVPLEEENSPKELIGAVFRSLIWIPYMLQSKRVRATFTKTYSAHAEPEEETVELANTQSEH